MRLRNCSATGEINNHFPTSACPPYLHRMRQLNREEIEFSILLFLMLAPLGYWIVRALFAAL
ncbi:hypothetical protein ERY430_41146 [Erythrobacter sp. EC-HK427]|nr:hypothetical protein ERY430_41146 [Erythrobacter sp. EC-HK427]